jgi:glycosyltransferase involved in cell wall biosynthesis
LTKGVLFISYDGMLEPLGQSQVFAYLKRLAVDRPIHLISFEKAIDWANLALRERLARDIGKAGIYWHPLRYHKRPTALATTWDIVCGTGLGLWLVLRHRLSIVHARSYIPSVMALEIKRMTGVKYLFDMRGFWADERVDGSLWPHASLMYRVAKGFEKRFLLAADHVVSLTHAGVREMQSFSYLRGRMPPISVISTCANLEHFKPLGEAPKELVLGYVGTAGTWYLFEETVAVFSELIRMRPDARILIVNRNEHDFIRERLVAGGVPLNAVELLASDYAGVPRQMARMTASVFFIKPVYSKRASAPTKLGELLGCGVPCLSNAGVGDVADIIEGERVGVAIKSFDRMALAAGLKAVLLLAEDPSTRARCVAAAAKHFSLDEGVTKYREIYKSTGG